MPLLILMSIAGSLPFLAYLILKKLLGAKIGIRYYRFLLKLSIFFYLFPFQYFKYALLPTNLIMKFKTIDMTSGHRIYSHEVVGIEGLDGTYTMLPNYIAVLYLVWLFFVVFFAYLTWRNYIIQKKEILGHSVEMGGELLSWLEEHPEFSKLSSKKLRVYMNPNISTPVAVGIFSPKIIFPQTSFSKEEYNIILTHELTHILHHDIIWKFVAILVSLIHWYNPLVYILLKDLSCECEYYCDEACTRNMTLEQKKKYALLIVRLAAEESSPSIPIPVFANGFLEGKNYLKRRIDLMIDERETVYFQKTIMVFFLCLSLAVIGSTILFYEDPIAISQAPEENWDSLGFNLEKDPIFSQFDGLKFHSMPLFFLDEEENLILFSSNGEENNKITCSHIYIEANEYIHKKQAKACKLKQYQVQICKKCGVYQRGRLKSISTYSICPGVK